MTQRCTASAPQMTITFEFVGDWTLRVSASPGRSAHSIVPARIAALQRNERGNIIEKMLRTLVTSWRKLAPRGSALSLSITHVCL